MAISTEFALNVIPQREKESGGFLGGQGRWLSIQEASVVHWKEEAYALHWPHTREEAANLQ